MDNQKLQKMNFIKIVMMSLMFGIVILSIVLSVVLDHGQDARLPMFYVGHWNTGWSDASGANISFPYKVASNDEKVVFINTLPDEIPKDYCISCGSYYCIVKVFVGEEKIYSYGEQMPVDYSRMLGNIRIMVPMKEEYAGKQIRIEYDMVYKAGYDHQGIILGNQYEVKFDIFNSNLWRIVACAVFGFIAILSFLLSFYHNSVNEKKHWIMFYYAFFNIVVASWIFYSSDLLQFFSSQNMAGAFVSYCSLILMPCIFSRICMELFEEQKKWYDFCKWIGVILWIMVMLFMILKIADPPQLIGLTHIYMFVVVISTVRISIKNARDNKLARGFCILLLIFCAFALGSVVAYYSSTGSGIDAQLGICGFIIFSIGLIVIIEKNHADMSKKIIENNLLKEQAYNDPMTKLGNRSAIDNKISELSEQLKETDSITYILCDLNYLKYTNDNYGHEAGDKMIQMAATCIREAVGDRGSCYRVGGDEFVIILVNHENKWDKIVSEIFDRMTEYNRVNTIFLSMAIGAETRMFDSKNPDFFRDLRREADRKMYAMKQQQHEDHRKRGIE